MKKSNIKVNDKITFKEEKLPYEVKAVNGRFAICTRKFDKKEDNGILEHKVEMQAYMTKKEAFEDLKDEVVYTIIDFKEFVRSTDNYVFGIYDYNKQEDIDSCLNDLTSGKCKLSKRNQITLTHFDVHRTI